MAMTKTIGTKEHPVKTQPTMKIGIATVDEVRARTIAIAHGEYKPKAGEPKIWFTSLKSAAELPSQDKLAVLEKLSQAKPASVAEAARIVGRRPNNLSPTLNQLARYGIVELKPAGTGREKRPVVKATRFEVGGTVFLAIWRS